MTLASIRSVGRCLAAATAVVFMLGGLPARAQEVTVTIDNFTFTPPELTVEVGDTVTWTHEGRRFQAAACSALPA